MSNGIASDVDEENPHSFDDNSEETIDFPSSTMPKENTETPEHLFGFEGNIEPNKNQSGSIENDYNKNILDPNGTIVEPVKSEVGTDQGGT